MKRFIAGALALALLTIASASLAADYTWPHGDEEQMLFRTKVTSLAGYVDSVTCSSAYLNSDTTTWQATRKFRNPQGWGDDAATDTLTWFAVGLYTGSTTSTVDSLTLTIQGSLDGVNAYTVRAAAIALATGTNQFLFSYAPLHAVRAWPYVRVIVTAVGGDIATLKGKWLFQSTDRMD